MRWLLLLVGSISHDRHYHIIQSRDEGGLQLCVCLYVNSGAPPHHHRFPFYAFLSSSFSLWCQQSWRNILQLRGSWRRWSGYEKRENISYIRCSRFLSLWMQTQPHAKVIWKPVSDTRVLNTLLCVLGLYIYASPIYRTCTYVTHCFHTWESISSHLNIYFFLFFEYKRKRYCASVCNR